MLIPAMFRAVRSLFAPGMIAVALWSMLFTILALASFIFLSGVTFTWLGEHSDNVLLAQFLPWAGTLGASFIAWFLFPGIMPVIVNFFDSHIAGLIEKQDYPANLATHEPPFWPELWHDVRFSLLAITLNILILPLYIFLNVLAPVIFYWLNGYLLGREFFVMAARRHIPLPEAIALRKQHAATVTIAGIALALLATLPITNLFAPFWGIALMTHLYHTIRRTPASALIPPAV